VLWQHCFRHFGRQLSQSASNRIAENWLAAIEGLPIPGILCFPKVSDVLNHALIVFGAIVL
jgi:hypothetical protein